MIYNIINQKAYTLNSDNYTNYMHIERVNIVLLVFLLI